MGQVMNLGVFGLEVQVFQEQFHSLFFGVGHAALQALQGRQLPCLQLGTEMVAAVHHHPVAVQHFRQVYIAPEVLVHGVADIRRELGDID